MSCFSPLGKISKSNHYLLKCPHCGYSEKVQLKSDDFYTWVSPECATDEERLVDTLPKQCHHCTHKLIITLIPRHVVP